MTNISTTHAFPSLFSVVGLLTPGLLALGLLAPAPASAAPLASLKDQGFDALYGDYAPRGDCRGATRLTIGESGFVFHALGRTHRPSMVDYAPSFMGQAYDGITAVFFPFPRSSQDPGWVVMYVNDDEKPGRIRFEADVPPGQRADPFHAAIAGASPFERCGGAPPAKASPAVRTAPIAPGAQRTAAPARAVGTPLEWTNLAALAGRYPGDGDATQIDLFERGAVAAALRALLGPRIAALRANLAVVSPLERHGRIYSLSGNAAHRGGIEQAYVLIDPARRAVQVGLWEKGKLRVYAPSGGRIPLPAGIAALVDRSPPETATALPGTPWETMAVAGRPPAAHVAAAGSPTIESFSLFCDNGSPVLAMLLNKPSAKNKMTLSWNFAGELIHVPLQRAHPAGTFWQGSLSGSPLLARLMQRRGNAMLRLDGRDEGEASLTNAASVLRPALRACVRL